MTEPTQQPIGRDGEPCATCGQPLAGDQRYCLNCGQRRAGIPAPTELLDRQAADRGETPTPAPAPATESAPEPPSRDVSPIAAVGGIALLGVMLLVGVLIGRGGEESNAEAPPPVVEVAEPTTTTPSETGVTAPQAETPEVTETPANEEEASGGRGSNEGGNGGGSGSGSGDGDRSETVEEPEASADQLEALESATGEDAAAAQEELEDAIVTPEEPPTDSVAPGTDAGVQEIK